MTTVHLTLPRLYPKQHAALYSPARLAVIEASTKSGKTAGAMVWLLDGAWNEGAPGRAYWWVAPIRDQAKIVYRRYKDMCTRFDPKQQDWTPNESELIIVLGNGARLFFKGADHPDSLYGDDVYRAVIDEATRMKAEAWYAVRSTLTYTKGPIRIIGNVKGRKNWCYRLARRAEAGEPGMSYAKITAHDAVDGGVLTDEDIENAQRDLPEDVFRELYLAEPTEDGSNPFGLAHIAACCLPVGQPLPMGSAVPVCYGVDLAKSVDWTVVYGLDRSGSVVRFERWQGTPWDQTIGRISGIIGSTPALVDQTGVGAPVVDELRRAGCYVEGYTFTQASKQALMGRLAVAIQRREIAFPDGVTRTELEAFEFEHTASGVRYSAPDGMHDDCVCALALAVWKLDSCTRGGSSVEWADDRRPALVVPAGKSEYDVRREDPDWGF